MNTRAFRLIASLALLGASLGSGACYPDNDDDDNNSADTGNGRPGRPGAGDSGATADGGTTDASTDAGTPDAPTPGPGDADYPTFAAAWAAYTQLIRSNAAYAACPCMIQFGMAESQADCESQINGQLDSQMQCVEYSLRQSEGSALGHLNCLIPLYEESNRCYDTADLDCLNPPPCEPDEAAVTACDDRLTTAQRSALEQCGGGE